METHPYHKRSLLPTRLPLAVSCADLLFACLLTGGGFSCVSAAGLCFAAQLAILRPLAAVCETDLPGGSATQMGEGAAVALDGVEVGETVTSLSATAVLDTLTAIAATQRFDMTVAFFSKKEKAVAQQVFESLGAVLTPATAPNLGGTRKLYRL